MATLSFDPPNAVHLGNVNDLLAHTCGGTKPMLTLRKTPQGSGSVLGEICYGSVVLTSAYAGNSDAVDQWFSGKAGGLIAELEREQAAANARITLAAEHGTEAEAEDLRLAQLPVAELVRRRDGVPEPEAAPPVIAASAWNPEEEIALLESDSSSDGGYADAPPPELADTVVADLPAPVPPGRMADLEHLASVWAEGVGGQELPAPPPPSTLQAQNPTILPGVGTIIEVREWDGPWRRAKVTDLTNIVDRPSDSYFEAEALDEPSYLWQSSSGKPWRYLDSTEPTPAVPVKTEEGGKGSGT